MKKGELTKSLRNEGWVPFESREYEVKDDDGNVVGKIGYKAAKAINEGRLFKYTPSGADEEKVFSYLRKKQNDAQRRAEQREYLRSTASSRQPWTPNTIENSLTNTGDIGRNKNNDDNMSVADELFSLAKNKSNTRAGNFKPAEVPNLHDRETVKREYNAIKANEPNDNTEYKVPINNNKQIKIKYGIKKRIDSIANQTELSSDKRAKRIDDLIERLELNDDEKKNAISYAGIKKLGIASEASGKDGILKEITQPVVKFLQGTYDAANSASRFIFKDGMKIDGDYTQAYNDAAKYYAENPDQLGNDLFNSELNGLSTPKGDYLRDVNLDKILEIYNDTTKASQFISDAGFRSAGQMLGDMAIASMGGVPDAIGAVKNTVGAVAAGTRAAEIASKVANISPKIKEVAGAGVAAKAANVAIGKINSASVGKAIGFLNPLDNPTTALMGISAAQEKYDNLKQMGYDDETAKKNALFTGYVSTITEKMGYDGTPESLYLLKNKYIAGSASASAKKNTKKIIRDYLSANVSEGVEEIYNTVLERTGDVFSRVGYVDENGDIRQRKIFGNEGIFDIADISENFLGGFVGGAVMGSVGLISNVAQHDTDTVREYADTVRKQVETSNKIVEEYAKAAGAENISFPDEPDWNTATIDEINEYYQKAVDAHMNILSDENVIKNDEEVVRAADNVISPSDAQNNTIKDTGENTAVNATESDPESVMHDVKENLSAGGAVQSAENTVRAVSVITDNIIGEFSRTGVDVSDTKSAIERENLRVISSLDEDIDEAFIRRYADAFAIGLERNNSVTYRELSKSGGNIGQMLTDYIIRGRVPQGMKDSVALKRAADKLKEIVQSAVSYSMAAKGKVFGDENIGRKTAESILSGDFSGVSAGNETSVHLTRVGEHYEAYGADATALARLTGVSTYYKSGSDGRVLTAGVPVSWVNENTSDGNAYSAERYNADGKDRIILSKNEIVDFPEFTSDMLSEDEKMPWEKTAENKKITIDMSDDARAEILNKKSINVVSVDTEKAKALDDIDFDALQKTLTRHAKPIVEKVAKDFGILNKTYFNPDIELDFEYSRGSLKESINKQHSRYGDFIKMLSVFSDVVENAVGVETHEDKYIGTTREDASLKQMYVLASALSDDTGIIPVKLEVKEFNDKANKLYLSVVLTKKESRYPHGNLEQSPLNTATPASAISIADLVGIVNPSEGDFLKYFPDSMLDSEQIDGKNKALAKDAVKVEKLKTPLNNEENGTETAKADSNTEVSASGKELYRKLRERYGNAVTTIRKSYTKPISDAVIKDLVNIAYTLKRTKILSNPDFTGSDIVDSEELSSLNSETLLWVMAVTKNGFYDIADVMIDVVNGKVNSAEAFDKIKNLIINNLAYQKITKTGLYSGGNASSEAPAEIEKSGNISENSENDTGGEKYKDAVEFFDGEIRINEPIDKRSADDVANIAVDDESIVVLRGNAELGDVALVYDYNTYMLNDRNTHDERRARLLQGIQEYYRGNMPEDGVRIDDEELRFSISTQNSENDASFSLSEPEEETKNLIAVHNLSAKKLEGTLELGGFPMPSIAVTKDTIGHENFGDISIVFYKDTIDPKANEENKVYSADAWTPVFPPVEYEANSDKVNKIRNKYLEISRKYGYNATRALYKYSDVSNIEDKMNSVGGERNLIEDAKSDVDLMQVFLYDIGAGKVEPIEKKTVSKISDSEAREYDYFIEKLGKDAFDEMRTNPEESPIKARKEWFNKYGEKFDNTLREYLSERFGFSEEQTDNVVNAETTASKSKKAIKIRNYIMNGKETVSTEYDYSATADAIKKLAAENGFEDWVDNLLTGVEKSKGLYNGKDPYTNMGDRKSFSQLHYDVTLENIVKAMKTQGDGDMKNVSGFHGIKTLRAASAKTFKNIADIHNSEGKIKNLSEEEAQEINDRLGERLSKIINYIYAKKAHSQYENSLIEFDRIGEIITECCELEDKSPENIKALFKNYRYDIDNKAANGIVQLLFDVAQMPVHIFEAKPGRVVSFDEIAFAAVPKGKYPELKRKLEGKGIKVKEYDPDVDGSRLDVLNSEPDVKFSVSRGIDADRGIRYNGDTYSNTNGKEGKESGNGNYSISENEGRNSNAHSAVKGRPLFRIGRGALGKRGREKYIQNLDREYDTERGVINKTVKAEFIRAHAYNDDMREMESDLKALGFDKVGFFVGAGRLAYRPLSSCSAVIFKNSDAGTKEVYLRYDDGEYSPRQLAVHEIGHDIYSSRLGRKIKNIIENSIPLAERNAIMQQKRYKLYAEALGDPDLVFEEFVCDVLGGMTEYSSTHFENLMNAFWNQDLEFIDNYKVAEYTESIDAGGISVNTNDFNFSRQNMNKARSDFVDYARNNFPKSVINTETKKEIGISRTGIDKFLSGNISKEKYATGFVIPKLIESASKVGEAENKKGKTGITGYEYYYNTLFIDGSEYAAHIRVRNTDMGDKYYGHTISKNVVDINIEPLAWNSDNKMSVHPINAPGSIDNTNITQKDSVVNSSISVNEINDTESIDAGGANADVIDSTDFENDYRLSSLNQLYLPTREYAMVSKAIMAKNAGLTDNELKPVDYVYAADEFYIYENNSLGDFTVVDKLDTVNDANKIGDVKELIDNGAYANRKEFNRWADGVRGREGSNTGIGSRSENKRPTVGNDRLSTEQQKSDTGGYFSGVGEYPENKKVRFSIVENDRFSIGDEREYLKSPIEKISNETSAIDDTMYLRDTKADTRDDSALVRARAEMRRGKVFDREEVDAVRDDILKNIDVGMAYGVEINSKSNRAKASILLNRVLNAQSEKQRENYMKQFAAFVAQNASAYDYSDDYSKDIDNFGDAAELRSEIIGRLHHKVYLSDDAKEALITAVGENSAKGYIAYMSNPKNGLGVDVIHREFLEDYPGYFSSDAVGEDKAIRDIMRVYKQLGEFEKQKREKLIDILDVDDRKDFAEVVYSRVHEALYDGGRDSKLSAELAKSKAKADEKNHRLEAKYKEKLADVRTKAREHARERIEKMKLDFKDKENRRRTEVKERKDRQKLLNIARRLDNMRLHPNDRAAVDALIGELDLVAGGITEKNRLNLEKLREEYKATPVYTEGSLKDRQNILERIARLDKTQISDMSIEDVQELTEALIRIRHQIQTQNTLINKERRYNVYMAANTAISEIEYNKKDKARNKSVEKYYLASLSPMRFFKRLSGWNEDSVMYELAEDLNEGAHKEQTFKLNASKPFDEFNEKHKHIYEKWQKDVVKIPTIGIELTPAMRIELVLSSECEANLNHIMNGGVTLPDMEYYRKGEIAKAYDRSSIVKLSYGDLQNIKSSMTTEEKQFAELLRHYYNTVSKDAINEASLPLNGYEIARVKNYYPINTDSNFVRREIESLLRDGTIEGQGNLKERNNSTNPIVLGDAISTLMSNMDSVSKYYGLAIPIRNFMAVFNQTTIGYGNSVKRAITTVFGSESVQYIEKLISDLQFPKKTSGKFVMLRGNFAQATLAANPSVMLKQTASFPTAAAVLGFDNMAKALMRGRVDMNLIDKYTPLMWYRRQGNIDTALSEAKKSHSIMRKIAPRLTSVVMDGIQKFDILTVGRVWKAAEAKVSSETDLKVDTDEFYREVARQFNKAVEETQPNYSVMQRPQALRSDSELTKSVVMFATQRLQNVNMAYDATFGLKRAQQDYKTDKSEKNAKKLRSAKVKFASTHAALILSSAMIAGINILINGLLNKRDREDLDEEFAKEFVSSYVGNLLFGSEICETLSALILKDKRYDMSVPQLDMINQVLNALISLENNAESGKSIAGDVRTIAKLGGQFFGIPVQNLEKYIVGTIGIFSPEFKANYDNFFYPMSSKYLDKLEPDSEYYNAAFKIVAEGRYGTMDNDTAAELCRLYKANREGVLMSETTSVTIDKVKHTDGEQFDKYVSERVKLGNEFATALIKSNQYKSADDSKKIKYLSKAYDFATDFAKHSAYDFELSNKPKNGKNKPKLESKAALYEKRHNANEVVNYIMIYVDEYSE